MKKRRIVFIAILFVILTLALTGCESSKEKSDGFFYTILTLSFLPSGIETLGYNHGLFDGNILSHTITIPFIGFIGIILEVIINYFIVLFTNIFDFLLWFIAWIPFVDKLIDTIYSAPDAVEKWSFYGSGKYHRGFLSHSVGNLIFIVYFVVGLLLRRIKIVRLFAFILGLVFVFHLFADTMPESWRGFSTIKGVLFEKSYFNLSPFFSKLWLYINAFIGMGLVTLIVNDDDED